MTIDYGFVNDNSPEADKAAAREWTKDWTKHEVAVFHQLLPFMCMASGIGVICSSTVEVLVRRLETCQPGWIVEIIGHLDLDKADPVDSLTRWLQGKLIGYRTNTGMDSDAEFIKRHTRNLPKADLAADDDKARFMMRMAYAPKFTARDVARARTVFHAERAARIAATPVEAEIEVCVG